eukprot:5894703-Prymnesium_polylepis.1
MNRFNPPPTLAALEQLRALGGRQRQAIGRGDPKAIGLHGPLEDGQLANGSMDGCASVEQRNSGRIGLPE